MGLRIDHKEGTNAEEVLQEKNANVKGSSNCYTTKSAQKQETSATREKYLTSKTVTNSDSQRGVFYQLKRSREKPVGKC